ncbi:right-handed parallel beta-helix repeat-containing protein [Tahibacter caeni]|uniref:right-handed parallel beta-helix repeat-containing protein n=1 Tax=Tahibacter caeni TaxID=1453545 RepID=UPI0021477AF7|nr:right-handed parallel beta-helix repeat-containing protein [Tahibacter caeni]
MKAIALIRQLVAVVLLYSLFIAGAHAQATRTWVSGVGDDANPCSRTAPCKTFAGAISKTAAQGTINALDPAGYGAVTITKSITIDGTGTNASILSAGTNGIIINAATTDTVVIRNVNIEGVNTGLNGIRVLQAGTVILDNVFITRVTQKGVDVAPASTAVNFNAKNVRTFAAAGGGIVLTPGATGSVTATIDGSSFDSGSIGMQVNARAKATVRNSTAANNSGAGFSANGGSGATLVADNVVSSNNAGAGFAAVNSGSLVTISRSATLNNGIGLQALISGVVQSFGDNRNVGNAVPGGVPPTIPLQ